jgi:hypothetical protein
VCRHRDVRVVELAAGDVAQARLDTHGVREFEHGLAGDARQCISGGRCELAVLDDDDVETRAIGDAVVDVQQDRGPCAAVLGLEAGRGR